MALVRLNRARRTFWLAKNLEFKWHIKQAERQTGIGGYDSRATAAGRQPWGSWNKEPSLTDEMTHSCCCCCCEVASVVSDSVRPSGRQPTRLPRPWDSPGKNVFLRDRLLEKYKIFHQAFSLKWVQFGGKTEKCENSVYTKNHVMWRKAWSILIKAASMVYPTGEK